MGLIIHEKGTISSIRNPYAGNAYFLEEKGFISSICQCYANDWLIEKLN